MDRRFNNENNENNFNFINIANINVKTNWSKRGGNDSKSSSCNYYYKN